mgnify:CR=1 FL=1
MASRKTLDVDEYPSKRFRKSRTCEEERDMLVNAVPISTRYKNKWAVNLFTEWIRDRKNHSAALEQTSLNISLSSRFSQTTVFIPVELHKQWNH